MHIYDDNQLIKYVELLNALYPEYFGWQVTHARKDHEDEFENIIKSGEIYFTREIDSWNRYKLSKKSMSNLICCIFGNNPSLLSTAENILKEREIRFREKTQKVKERMYKNSKFLR